MNGAQLIRCPHCGQPRSDLPRLDTLCVALGMVGAEKKLFTILSAARGRYLTMNELVLMMYFECEDGGPADAAGTVAVLISRLRCKIANYPIRIEEKSIKDLPVRLVAKRWVIRRPPGGYGYQLIPVAA